MSYRKTVCVVYKIKHQVNMGRLSGVILTKAPWLPEKRICACVTLNDIIKFCYNFQLFASPCPLESMGVVSLSPSFFVSEFSLFDDVSEATLPVALPVAFPFPVGCIRRSVSESSASSMNFISLVGLGFGGSVNITNTKLNGRKQILDR